MAKVGFIGLGSQGAPMAQRIIDAGHEVTLWARSPSTLEPFIHSGATFAESIGELAARSDYVGLCVVDDAGVRQICDELIPSMHTGGCIMIHSTVNPNLCKEIGHAAAEKGIGLLDAPVSGGGTGAAQGTLTVMVGGCASTLDAARPIVESYAGLIVHLGGIGCGQQAKLVNNTLMAAHVAIAHHALQLAEALGMDRDALVKLVNVSSGRSFGFDVYARQESPSAFQHGAQLLLKDVLLLESALEGHSKDHADFSSIRDLTLPFIHSILNTSSN